jgi:hypothetical protein
MGVRMPLPSSSGLGGVSGIERLRATPNAPFFLIHYPYEGGSWSVETEGLDGPTWVPDLRPFGLVPGCGGVRTIERGEHAAASYEQAILNLQRRGAVVYLPESETMQITSAEYLPAGVPAGPYIRQVETSTIPDGHAAGVPYYHLAHEQMSNGRTPTAPHKRVLDAPAWNRWRVALVDAGVIATPHDDVIQERIELQRSKVASASRDTRANADVRAAAVDTQSQRLARMESARVPGRTPPKKTTKRTRATG